jgi:hypothetical protein
VTGATCLDFVPFQIYLKHMTVIPTVRGDTVDDVDVTGVHLLHAFAQNDIL